MAKRKNPRNPVKVRTLHSRLEQLWSCRTGRRWPALRAATLWYIQYAGLRHLISRGDALAERWVAVLEDAVRHERALGDGSTLLSGAASAIPFVADEDLPTRFQKRLEAFANTDLRRGKPKAGRDWEPLDEAVRSLTATFARLNGQAPPAASLAWWDLRIRRLYRYPLHQSDQLSKLDVYNVYVSRKPRTRALSLTARAHRMDPRHLDKNLKRWRARNGAPMT